MGFDEVYVELAIGPRPSVRMAPGGLIGRLRTADLRIDDPRVSEAHAYVSVRDGKLTLLALRGGLAVEGQLVRDVPLAAGRRITLAKGDPEIVIDVVEVRAPTRMLALAGPGLDAQLLTGRCLSLVRQPHVALVGGFQPNAEATLWTDGAGWVGQVQGGPARPLEPGQELVIANEVFQVVEVGPRQATTPDTDLDGRIAEPLRIEGYFDTVHLHRPGQAALVLSGAPARLIYELGTIGQPVAWQAIATTLWHDNADESRLRKRWDVLMVRLRKRLADASIRPSLVQADGGGKVRLLLEPADAFRDCG